MKCLIVDFFAMSQSGLYLVKGIQKRFLYDDNGVKKGAFRARKKFVGRPEIEILERKNQKIDAGVLAHSVIFDALHDCCIR